LNDFCDIVSHNLRAPLASISMLADYIERCSDQEEKQEMVSKIKPVANNLNEIFNELVESLQIEQDHTIQSDHNILSEIIEKIVKRFEIEIELHEVEIILDIHETPIIIFPYIYLDSILSNLISNSIKYKFPNRKPIIKISTKNENDSIILSITDNGLGIDLFRHKNNIFKIRKVFHDHPDAKGFGLYISKKQIDALGGRIWVESTPNIGSTFFIEFINQKNNQNA
jgi:light-regulated signal transduction histidine kinase (bacteriophytochrome)